jgi:hypothetical protein
MTPNDTREFWTIFLLLSPLIVLSGGGQFLVLLVVLGGIAYAPFITIALCVAWLLRWIIADFFLALVGGFGLGLGLKGSGFARRLSNEPRQSLPTRWRARGGRFRGE